MSNEKFSVKVTFSQGRDGELFNYFKNTKGHRGYEIKKILASFLFKELKPALMGTKQDVSQDSKPSSNKTSSIIDDAAF